MNKIIENYQNILNDIKQLNGKTNLVAVSKFQSCEKIRILLDLNHKIFAESRVEEAYEKWIDLKKYYDNLELHYIGGIQSKKIKKIVDLFDVIESVDKISSLDKIESCAAEANKIIRIFIQINIGNEPQKSGVSLDELPEIYNKAKQYKHIILEGFMCIPPNTQNVEPFFKKMIELKKTYNIKYLSMGMSNDYLTAIKFNSNFIRVGSYIFGQRKNPN
jgi:PLP dependent protein